VIRFSRALLRVDTDLQALRVRWALLGGLAVGIHAEPRTTRDMDIAVAATSDSEAERVILALRGRGYREHPPGIGQVLEHKEVGRLLGVRLIVPGETEEGVVVDFLFGSSGVEPEIVGEAERREIFPGVYAPVVRAGHLLALKILAGRPKDLEDGRALLQRMDERELERTRRTLDLIERRGYHRQKDLLVELGKLIDSL
jgi:hypothetical protein